MKRLTLLLLLCFWCGTSALAQTGTSKTPAALNTETNALWPDNTAGSITPFNARQTLLDIIASSAPFSGTTCLSSLQQYQAFANTTSAPTGTTLNFFDGSVCVPWATFNQTAHTITLASATIPPPTAATLGGVFSITQVAHNWITYIDTTGLPHQAQPALHRSRSVRCIRPSIQAPAAIGGIAYADAHVNVLRNSSLTRMVPRLRIRHLHSHDDCRDEQLQRGGRVRSADRRQRDQSGHDDMSDRQSRLLLRQDHRPDIEHRYQGPLRCRELQGRQNRGHWPRHSSSLSSTIAARRSRRHCQHQISDDARWQRDWRRGMGRLDGRSRRDQPHRLHQRLDMPGSLHADRLGISHGRL